MLPNYDVCAAKFDEYGLGLTLEMYRKFDIYADFLVEYNQNVNLTAITEPEQILIKHFIDSVLMLKYAEIPEKCKIRLFDKHLIFILRDCGVYMVTYILKLFLSPIYRKR